eukprot:1160088-Pelagomonas_calceolata.AAC.5
MHSCDCVPAQLHPQARTRRWCWTARPFMQSLVARLATKASCVAWVPAAAPLATAMAQATAGQAVSLCCWCLMCRRQLGGSCLCTRQRCSRGCCVLETRCGPLHVCRKQRGALVCAHVRGAAGSTACWRQGAHGDSGQQGMLRVGD